MRLQGEYQFFVFTRNSSAPGAKSQVPCFVLSVTTTIPDVDI